MLLLLAAFASAGSMATATLDAPAPVVADLDLLPEPGAAWPCKLTVQVDGMGAVTDVAVASGCPSGLVDTAKALGKGWKWEPAAAPHAEEVTVTFKVLRQDDVEPLPESTADKLVYLVRPMDVLPAPPTTETDAAATHRLDKGPKTKLPKGASAARLVAGTCSVRVSVGADGKVTAARANRCLDLLAPTAVASAKKLVFEVPKGNTATAEFDVPVRFTTP